MGHYQTEEPTEDTEVNSQTLSDACTLLFGENTEASPEFIRYMQIAGLKAAFRNLAMRNHPDMASQIGVAAPVLQQRFTEIRQAYELLLPYVAGERRLPSWQTPRPDYEAPEAAPPPKRTTTAYPFKAGDRRFLRRSAHQGKQTFSKGHLPKRILRIGEFLYYSSRVSWENMFSALVWQRLSRPRLGEIALEKGFFTASDMLDIRRFRQIGEPIGATALRLRIIEANQLRLLLGCQKIYNAPLGRYFVDEDILTPYELAQQLNLQRAHNMAHVKNNLQPY
jgi:hypothetical protein